MNILTQKRKAEELDKEAVALGTKEIAGQVSVLQETDEGMKRNAELDQ